MRLRANNSHFYKNAGQRVKSIKKKYLPDTTDVTEFQLTQYLLFKALSSYAANFIHTYVSYELYFID